MQPVIKQMTEQDCFLVRAAANYEGKRHQKTALEALQRSLTPQQLDAFQAAYSPAQAPVAKPQKVLGFPLEVPYFYQRDSKTGHGERMCFSSSMAMALDYIDPVVIQGDDDWYLRQVLRHGDTVSSDAQVAAARDLRFDAEFHDDGTQADLERLLNAGVPVPIGILHKGPISSPSGGGHWICLIGHDDLYFMVHDPFGELDLVNGGYPKTGPIDGRGQLYSKKNLMKRWLIKSQADGWYVNLVQE